MLELLAQIAALPADQWAALARLLALRSSGGALSPALDDRLPATLERTAGQGGGAKGVAG